ncbi:MAG: hypothetical protein KDA33_09965, partial [Phycisphaerales bacterium]|nr:hypothetical protein [Phycisphaerales bacterium]
MPDNAPSTDDGARNPTTPSDNAADQLIEVAAIAGGLAHEVRNALSTLRVGLQLLDEDWRELDTAEDGATADIYD